MSPRGLLVIKPLSSIDFLRNPFCTLARLFHALINLPKVRHASYRNKMLCTSWKHQWSYTAPWLESMETFWTVLGQWGENYLVPIRNDSTEKYDIAEVSKKGLQLKMDFTSTIICQTKTCIAIGVLGTTFEVLCKSMHTATLNSNYTIGTAVYGAL